MTLPATDDAALSHLAAELGHDLLTAGAMLTTAESCTGGWIAQILTSVSGSSAWFERGFVTYSNAAKHDMLGVPDELLQAYGAVSEPTAKAMAVGAIAGSRADRSVAVTGIAGPGGGSADKPVGCVWIAWACRSARVDAEGFQFQGEREAVRRQSVAAALAGLRQRL